MAYVQDPSGAELGYPADCRYPTSFLIWEPHSGGATETRSVLRSVDNFEQESLDLSFIPHDIFYMCFFVLFQAPAWSSDPVGALLNLKHKQKYVDCKIRQGPSRFVRPFRMFSTIIQRIIHIHTHTQKFLYYLLRILLSIGY